jgi:acyl-CoA hydrolase
MNLYDPIVTYRALVMPKHLNAANRLFGGQMMAWMDEAAALFVMCKTNSTDIVTAKVSEVVFNKPVVQGDFLSFKAHIEKVGRTSLTIKITAIKRTIGELPRTIPDEPVCQCEMVFVTIDPQTGRGVPHGLQE